MRGLYFFGVDTIQSDLQVFTVEPPPDPPARIKGINSLLVAPTQSRNENALVTSCPTLSALSTPVEFLLKDRLLLLRLEVMSHDNFHSGRSRARRIYQCCHQQCPSAKIVDTPDQVTVGAESKCLA